jgi:ABC-2 type transport system permease protein
VNAVPYVIAGAVVVFAVLRRRRARRGERPGARADVPQAPRRHPLGDTGLVAAREVRERVRGRFFKGITAILLLVVGAAIVLPTIHTSAPEGSARIGVVRTVDVTLRDDVVLAAARTGVAVRLVGERSPAAARAALRAGRVTLVVQGRSSVLVRTSSALAGGSDLSKAANAVASALGAAEAFRAAGLTYRQVAEVAHAGPVPVASLEPASRNGAARGTSLVGLVLVFVMLTQYLTWTLMGVMEEKVSRVVEVLLATVRPMQLLGGKLLGIGAVLHGTSPMVVVASLVWLVVGYAFYSWVYAAAGSMTARQDQVQSLALPLSVPIIFGYVVALANAGPGAPSLLVEVLAYLPPTAPFGMPLLVAKGAVSWWEFAAAIVASLAGTIGVARLAANVYSRAVLRTGRRLRLRELVGPAR